MMITRFLPAPPKVTQRLSGKWLALTAFVALLITGTTQTVFADVDPKKAAQQGYTSLAATLPAELAAAKKAGISLSVKTLMPQSPVTDAENAARFYRSMTALYLSENYEQSETDFLAAHPAILKQAPRTSRDDQDIRDYLQARAEFLRIAEQAAGEPKCDFARNWSKGMNVTFPEYPVMRSAARVLMLRAALRTDENQPQQALQDVALAGRIGVHCGSEQIAIAALVKIAIQEIAHARFIEILQRFGNNPAIFPDAKKAADTLNSPSVLRYAFSGEMVVMNSFFKDLRDSSAPWGEARQIGIPLPTPPSPQARQKMAEAWQARSLSYWRKALSIIGASKGDLLAVERGMTLLQQEEAAHQSDAGYELSAAFATTFTKMPTRVMQQRASNNLRQEMLALLEFRQQKGNFPESLKELPDGGTKSDPFSNQPLKYTKTDKGFLLYSVGNNRIDDGGSSKSIKINEASWSEDIVVSYP